VKEFCISYKHLDAGRSQHAAILWRAMLAARDGIARVTAEEARYCVSSIHEASRPRKNFQCG
jgi:hypothetical protein